MKSEDNTEEQEWEPRPDPSAICKACSQKFVYSRIDNQINESWYSYCDTCGATGLLYDGNKLPKKVLMESGYELAASAEFLLPRCHCGGAFKHGALPRCPHCSTIINREEIISLLDHYYSKREWSAATSKKGDLQNCLVIENRLQIFFEDQ